MSWVNAVVQGLLLGGLYALFACGLSLMFGVMRLINLAHGDLAVVAAYLAVLLFHGPSFLVVVPLFAVVGYLMQRSLLQASLERGELTTLLVTFGLSIVISNLLLEAFSADSHSLAAGSLASSSIRITDHVAVGQLSLVIFAVAVAVLATLQVYLSRSATGRLIRAVADDREAARMAGVDPRHVFGVAAAIAFATVAVAGLAFGTYSSFAPSSGASRLLFAFEAVVIGGLGSLWGTLLGGMVLGVAQAVGAQINPAYAVLAGHAVFLAVLAIRPSGLVSQSALPHLRPALRSALRPRSALRSRLRSALRSRPRSRLRDLAVVHGVMSVMSAKTGGTTARSRVVRGRAWLSWLGLLVVVAVLGYLPFLVYAGTTDTLINLFILLTLASMWNLMAGYAGLVSVGQQAYLGLGAYFVLILAQLGVMPFAAIPLAAVLCAVVALPVSWLVLRLRGGYFAIATWVVADAAQLVVSRFTSLGGGTGRALPGLAGTDPTMLTAYTYWAGLAIVVVAFVGGYLILRGRLGLALTAVRDNEIGAQSLGVRVTRTRRLVYLVAALGCGAAGGLLIVSQLNVEPTSAFNVQWAAAMVFVTVIGGIGSVEGPIIGTIVYFVLQQTLASYGAWYQVVVGVIAIVVALWAPTGLWGLITSPTGLRLFPVGYRLR